MIYFIEFNLNDNQKISVNVGKINNIFESSKEGETKICMGEEDVFSVRHSYNEVLNMITNFSDVIVCLL